MINCKNNDKIISYIENELNESDKKQFETALKVDKDLNSEYNEILNLSMHISMLEQNLLCQQIDEKKKELTHFFLENLKNTTKIHLIKF